MDVVFEGTKKGGVLQLTSQAVLVEMAQKRRLKLVQVDQEQLEEIELWWVEQGGKVLLSWTRICGEVGKCIRRVRIVRIQITNKIIRRIHRSYTVLYTQGTPTSGANVSPDEGIALALELDSKAKNERQQPLNYDITTSSFVYCINYSS